MCRPLEVTDVRLVGAMKDDVERGLIAFLSFTIDGLVRVDGVTLRRTRDDRVTLSFPSRVDSQGRRHSILRPVDDASRRHIEHQVFKALRVNAEIAR